MCCTLLGLFSACGNCTMFSAFSSVQMRSFDCSGFRHSAWFLYSHQPLLLLLLWMFLLTVHERRGLRTILSQRGDTNPPGKRRRRARTRRRRAGYFLERGRTFHCRGGRGNGGTYGYGRSMFPSLLSPARGTDVSSGIFLLFLYFVSRVPISGALLIHWSILR